MFSSTKFRSCDTTHINLTFSQTSSSPQKNPPPFLLPQTSRSQNILSDRDTERMICKTHASKASNPNWNINMRDFFLGTICRVSKNRGFTPNQSILIGLFPYKPGSILGCHYFMEVHPSVRGKYEGNKGFTSLKLYPNQSGALKKWWSVRKDLFSFWDGLTKKGEANLVKLWWFNGFRV